LSYLSAIYRATNFEQLLEEAEAPLSNWFKFVYYQLTWRCVAAREAELNEFVPEALAIWGQSPVEATGAAATVATAAAAAAATAAPALTDTDDRPQRVLGAVMALNWQKHADFYGQALEMWECYCRHHKDCRLVLDTQELPEEEYPDQVKCSYWENTCKTVKGKEWNRWLAASRHLNAFEAIITLDPDQYPSRECFLGASFSKALQLLGLNSFPQEGAAAVDIVMRDGPRWHGVQSTSVFFRRGPGARLFFRLLLEKMKWVNLPVLDQSAFEQTVLEFLDLWNHTRQLTAQENNQHASDQMKDGDLLHFQSTFCLHDIVPEAPAREFQLSAYYECWQNRMEELLGKFGDEPGVRGMRSHELGSPLFLADPRLVDLSYVLGPRQYSVPLIWHEAGRDKHYNGSTENTTVFDNLISSKWGEDQRLGPRLPARRRPSWARLSLNTEPTMPLQQWLPGVKGFKEPRCLAWTEAARRYNGACSPGTNTDDCTSAAWAFC